MIPARARRCCLSTPRVQSPTATVADVRISRQQLLDQAEASVQGTQARVQAIHHWHPAIATIIVAPPCTTMQLWRPWQVPERRSRPRSSKDLQLVAPGELKAASERVLDRASQCTELQPLEDARTQRSVRCDCRTSSGSPRAAAWAAIAWWRQQQHSLGLPSQMSSACLRAPGQLADSLAAANPHLARCRAHEHACGNHNKQA